MGTAVLYIEDDDVDAFLVKRAISRAGLNVDLYRLEGAKEGMDYLCGEGGFADRALYPMPLLVLLDLKLTGMDGFELLAWIRKQDEFKALPVVIRTSSDLDVDRTMAVRLGATDYLVKTPQCGEVIAMLLRHGLGGLGGLPLGPPPDWQLPPRRPQ